MARTRDPLRNYKFLVTIDGFAGQFGFKSVSGLSRSTEVIEYREGGDPATMRKIPGQTEFENIVLERGKYFGNTASGAADFLTWTEQIYDHDLGFLQDPNDADNDVPNNSGNGFRRTVTIELVDKAGTSQKQWRAFFAWPCVYEHEDLEADGNDVLIERLELCHEGLKEENLAVG